MLNKTVRHLDFYGFFGVVNTAFTALTHFKFVERTKTAKDPDGGVLTGFLHCGGYFSIFIVKKKLNKVVSKVR